MKVQYQLFDKDIELDIWDITWDNDSVGITEYGGAWKDDPKPDYISDFHIGEFTVLEPCSQEVYEEILKHDFWNDYEFIAILQDRALDYGY